MPAHRLTLINYSCISRTLSRCLDCSLLAVGSLQLARLAEHCLTIKRTSCLTLPKRFKSTVNEMQCHSPRQTAHLAHPHPHPHPSSCDEQKSQFACASASDDGNDSRLSFFMVFLFHFIFVLVAFHPQLASHSHLHLQSLR